MTAVYAFTNLSDNFTTTKSLNTTCITFDNPHAAIPYALAGVSAFVFPVILIFFISIARIALAMPKK
jgi:hypothetical protein